MMSDDKKRLTTSSGRPYYDHSDTLSAGPRGPLLLQDYILHEKMAHFNRERIPERVVHAKGSAAFGTFTVTHNISSLTRAKLFSKVGNSCRVLLRFSTVGGERGSADTERDPRGFAVKFYTEDGNWDLVGNNTPVFFIKDPKLFSDFIHTQKREPRSHLKSPTMMWDFWSLHPESLHQVMILMSSRGTPDGYRHMNGYGSHTFSMVNADGKRVWVKFHFKTAQGIRNMSATEASSMRGVDPDYAQRDLYEAIAWGDYPRWHLKIQVMTEEQAQVFPWNPFDLTKIWPHADYPLIDVGTLELNENPMNYFAEVEQSAFAPAHIIDGIGFSPDKMLQGRILSYPDAHRYRLGANYEQIPVNRCPFHVNNTQRDGAMRVDGNHGDQPNYYPNSFDSLHAESRYAEPAFELDSITADRYDRNGPGDDGHYSQPRALFENVMSDDERTATVENITASMSGIQGPQRDSIIQRQLSHFRKVSPTLADRVQRGLSA